MQHVNRLEDVQLQRPSLVTIGVFDGMHLGHQTLVRQLVNEAHAADKNAVVLTFYPHPDVVIRGIAGRYYLMSPEAKAQALGAFGVDYVVTHPFNDTIRQVRAAAFVDQLLQYLKLEQLWVGADFALGYQREGTVEFLQAQADEKNFAVRVVELVGQTDDGEQFNSSRIRQLLWDGKAQQAREWLGMAYSVEGTVIPGDARGRTIGFPTANLDIWDGQIIPATGVYAGWATVQGETHKAVTNIGYRPTFEGETLRVETHLLDFDRDIYGEQVHLTFEARLRGEKKFDGINALIAQIQEDITHGRELLG